MEQQNPQPPQSQQASIPLQMTPQQTSVHFANLCRGSMTPEEVFLDFGINPNAFARVSEDPIQITARVILTPPSAKRLLHLLHVMLSRHEESFGPIPIEPRLANSDSAKDAAPAT
jgi:hypothetical protein